MGKLTPETEEALQRYVEGTIDPQERLKIEEAISLSADMQKRVAEYKTLHNFLTQRSKLEVPSKNFTDKVMASLDHQPVPFISPRNGLFLLIGIVIACGIALSFISSGIFDSVQTVVTTDVVPKTDLLQNIPSWSLPITGKMLIKAILFLNLILAFILIDRTILRPYFQKRNYEGA